MDDKTLLELAAKAAGIDLQWRDKSLSLYRPDARDPINWNPLEDDGDALRLAVKLHIGSDCHTDAALVEHCCAWVNHRDVSSFYRVYEPYGSDAFSATRRAITRAAAEIGKSI